MATTDLTAVEIRSYITTLQRSLGGPSRVDFADGRSVSYASDEHKLTAIRYYESLLPVAPGTTTTAAPGRLVIGTHRGFCSGGNW